MDDYVKDWARAGSVGRCGSDHCDWMKDFGAIDVGCTFDVGRIGLNVKDAARGGRGPELVFTFGDGTTFDDDDWLYDGKDGRGCAWIAEKTFRCDGKDGAREACPATCGECEPACEDDETWFSKKSSNNCRWVAEKPDSRCSRKSDDKVKAKDACPVACGTCV
ncbi:hypothetical protein JL720_5432 [Aureococcus anophagefferens]|nr:hypothetical protein JL720_5432 [Aureococcus anophagefferens]